jgi:NitT/TauT family transport system ATP-binding protein
MLQIRDLDFFYSKDRLILRNLNIQIPTGQIVALIGSSGSGKTTLFRLIMGLLDPTCGRIEIQGPKPTFMQQDDLLLPWRTVKGNLSLAQELGSKPCCLPDEKLTSMLHLVGLAGYENAYPNELSGGQRQRVSLARALLQNRPLLLLDEPFGSLDILIREQLYELLISIRQELNKTIVLVTHDFRDALHMADRIIVLKKGTVAADFLVPEVCSEKQLAHYIRQCLLDEKMTQAIPPLECPSCKPNSDIALG